MVRVLEGSASGIAADKRIFVQRIRSRSTPHWSSSSTESSTSDSRTLRVQTARLPDSRSTVSSNQRSKSTFMRPERDFDFLE